MYSGDSLSILLFLVGTALAAMMGAITAPEGWRSNVLWLIAALFTGATLIWLVAPAASPIIQALKPIAVAAIQSGALVMVGTVGVVAIMQGSPDRTRTLLSDHDNSEVPKPPSFATRADSNWHPDLSIQNAVQILDEKKQWRSGRVYLNQSDKIEEIRRSLLSGKITSWGRAHPNENSLFQIDKYMWDDAEINITNNFAFFPIVNRSGYEIQLSRGEFELAYSD